MSNTIDNSKITSISIIVRNNRITLFGCAPGLGQAIDVNNAKVKIANKGNSLIRTLILGDGITDNGDGSITIKIEPEDFRKEDAKFEVYGISGLPNLEIANGTIKYIKGIC